VCIKFVRARYTRRSEYINHILSGRQGELMKTLLSAAQMYAPKPRARRRRRLRRRAYSTQRSLFVPCTFNPFPSRRRRRRHRPAGPVRRAL